jgi:hypothetical protein
MTHIEDDDSGWQVVLRIVGAVVIAVLVAAAVAGFAAHLGN